MPNEEQAEYWDGRGGAHWLAERDRYATMTAPYGELVIDVAALTPGERVLDVGCGMGPTTFLAGDRVGPKGSVLGVDLSGPMLDVARARAEDDGFRHVRFEHGDAQTFPFEPGSFDAAISRFGVMFFDDPKAAFVTIGGALRSGGRLAFACWQVLFSNPWIMVPAAAALEHVPMPDLGEPGAPGPFALAEPSDVTGILDAAGFAEIVIEAAERPMRIADDPDDFAEFARTSDMGQVLLEGASPAAASAAVDAMRQAVAPYSGPDGVVLNGSAWVVTARKA